MEPIVLMLIGSFDLRSPRFSSLLVDLVLMELIVEDKAWFLSLSSPLLSARFSSSLVDLALMEPIVEDKGFVSQPFFSSTISFLTWGWSHSP